MRFKPFFLSFINKLLNEFCTIQEGWCISTFFFIRNIDRQRNQAIFTYIGAWMWGQRGQQHNPLPWFMWFRNHGSRLSAYSALIFILYICSPWHNVPLYIACMLLRVKAVKRDWDRSHSSQNVVRTKMAILVLGW